MVNILFEILTEEIPFSLQQKAEGDLKNLWERLLQDKKINYGNINIFSTPRRLVSYICGVDETICDQISEKKGPSIEANSKAIDGFLKANNITIEDCEIRNTPKGDFYYFNLIEKGGLLKNLFPNLIHFEILDKMKFEKSMKYNQSRTNWARPIRNFLLMVEKNPQEVDFLNLSWGGISSNNFTQGHRFLAKETLKITNIDSYFNLLEENYVILDVSKRKEKIVQSIKCIAKQNNIVVVDNDKLITEIAYLVEYVEILEAKIPDRFMHLPRELMINIIAKNQRYINFLNKDGSLSNIFVIVSNMVTQDRGKTIIEGNQKVLNARLEDGLFFYDNDLKGSFIEKIDNLKKVNFFEGLGSLFDKKERVKSLFKSIFKEDQELLCDLYKIDLTTSVVFEIPDLQGIMGYYYAKAQGYEENISKAILEQYKPQGLNDNLPQSVLGAKISFLDKLDSLISLFSIGKKPSGSKDPFALRRAALGIIRIVKVFNFEVNLDEFVTKDVSDFIKDRLIFFEKENGGNIEIISSIIHHSKHCNILQMVKEIEMFQNLFKTEEGERIINLFKRLYNILDSYKLNDESANSSNLVDTKGDLLQENVEKELYQAFISSKEKVTTEIKNNDFAKSIKELAKLALKVNSFLDSIIINKSPSEEIKNNRILLLQNILHLVNQVFPFKALM